MTSVCPSRARRISCVMHARLSVDLVCVLIVCNSSMISWICFRASSPVNKYLCNKIVFLTLSFTLIENTAKKLVDSARVGLAW